MVLDDANSRPAPKGGGFTPNEADYPYKFWHIAAGPLNNTMLHGFFQL